MHDQSNPPQEGSAMTAPTPLAPAQEPTPAAPVTPAAPAVPAKPWGDDASFDPAKAWNLIEGLRADKERLSSRPTMTAEQQQQLTEYQTLVEASKSDQQRLQEAAAQSQREAEQARADAIRYKAAATHGIPADHFDLLGSGTEEEITARAEKVSALLAAQAAVPGATPPATRPLEQLRPGATPSEAQSEDDAVYERLFGKPA